MARMLPPILGALDSLAGLAGLLLVFSNRKKIGIILFLAYVATYVPFSIAGRYVISNHGGSDWTRNWCPQYLVCKYRAFSGRTRTVGQSQEYRRQSYRFHTIYTRNSIVLQ